MNSLNSVLLEGILVKEVEKVVIDKDTVYYLLCVKSVRSYQKQEERVIEETFVNVITDPSTIESKFDEFVIGRGLRVVGRLKQSILTEDVAFKTLMIQAEHLELKPIVSKVTKNDNYSRRIS